MPKEGRKDSYWEAKMHEYAMGLYRFKTGEKPGKKKWKDAILAIDSCPRKGGKTTDLLGRIVPCKCGYHSVTQSTVTRESVKPTASASTIQCSLCNATVAVTDFQEHLANQHAKPVQTAEEEPHFKQQPQSKPALFQVLRPVHSPAPPQTFQQSLQPKGIQSVQTEAQQEQFKQLSKVPQSKPVHSHVSRPVHSPAPPIQKSLQSKLIESVQTEAQEETQFIQLSTEPQSTSDDLHVSRPVHSPAPPKTTVQQSQPKQSKAEALSNFLPKQFKKIIGPADQAWIAECLYEANGQLRDKLQDKNWFTPPQPRVSAAIPDPLEYFRQRMFIWAPMRMWLIPLYCPKCRTQLQHGGIYPKAREVVDVDSRYYLVGADYPRCGKCKSVFCPWVPDILTQLDPSHRNCFPAVLTRYDALDKRCITLMKPRTLGNSSSFIQQAIHELHSEEWGKRCLKYLADCELHKKASRLSGVSYTYKAPPHFRSLPLAQWFETAHSHEILSHVQEMKAVITSTYGRVLKIDSTKKVTKKMAGDVGDSASWMTNIANENGEVLNSVLTTGEGPAWQAVCQGIVKRYKDAGEQEPTIIYVDRDCCSQTGRPAVLEWFKPWKTKVRLDVFHFMRRFTKGLTTEHHPLYGTFCSKLSSCIFVWDKADYAKLRSAKEGELKKLLSGVPPTEKQVTASIHQNELARHCRRTVRPIQEVQQMIDLLLQEMWELTDTNGVRLINPDSMKHVWETQKKHLPCIQDPVGMQMYTKTGTLQKGGKELDVLRCARGSSSLESFHRHQCAFIPGWRANAVHTQMYMVEGGSRWNINRSREALDLGTTSGTRMYNIQLMENINSMSRKILQHDLLPEFIPPGKPTGELIGVDYLLTQSSKGDLREPTYGDSVEDAQILPELSLEEASEMDFPDSTVCQAEDIVPKKPNETHSLLETTDTETPEIPEADTSKVECNKCGIYLTTDEMVLHVFDHAADDDFESEEPLVPETRQDPVSESEDSRTDSRGVPGWEAVDAMASYLVAIDTSTTALSTAETNRILELYEQMHEIDKSPTKYSMKSKKNVLPGPWRASRKRQGPTPGIQATERFESCPEFISKSKKERIVKLYGWIELSKGKCSA